MAIVTGTPDLDELVRRSHRARSAPAIGIALARSKHTLEAAVPDDIITALVGRVWPRVVQAVASLDGLGPSSGRPSPATVLTKHTRMSISRTASRTVRRISERRAEQRINRVLHEEFDPNTQAPEELARNQAERETFFSLVGAWRSELS